MNLAEAGFFEALSSLQLLHCLQSLKLCHILSDGLAYVSYPKGVFEEHLVKDEHFEILRMCYKSPNHVIILAENLILRE